MPVDAGKLKGLARRGLGAPPRDGMPELVGEEAPRQAEQPTVSTPAALNVLPIATHASVVAPTAPLPEPASLHSLPQAEPRGIVDGRTLRKSGRTVQLGTRVTERFAIDLRADAAASNQMIVEILEEAVAARRRLLALANPGETVEQVIQRLSAR